MRRGNNGDQLRNTHCAERRHLSKHLARSVVVALDEHRLTGFTTQDETIATQG
jgi:hypothetical protein